MLAYIETLELLCSTQANANLAQWAFSERQEFMYFYIQILPCTISVFVAYYSVNNS